MTKADREIEQLKTAIAATGVVVRIRTIDQACRVDVYWMTPAGVTAALRPFVNQMPLGLVRDLHANGFYHVGKDVPVDYMAHGIFTTAFGGRRPDMLELARELVSAHGIERPGTIEWVNRDGHSQG